jgi:hypothetical protein
MRDEAEDMRPARDRRTVAPLLRQQIVRRARIATALRPARPIRLRIRRQNLSQFVRNAHQKLRVSHFHFFEKLIEFCVVCES